MGLLGYIADSIFAEDVKEDLRDRRHVYDNGISMFHCNRGLLTRALEGFAASIWPRHQNPVSSFFEGNEPYVQKVYLPLKGLEIFEQDYAKEELPPTSPASSKMNALCVQPNVQIASNEEVFRWTNEWRQRYMFHFPDGWRCKNHPTGIAGMKKGAEIIRRVYYVGHKDSGRGLVAGIATRRITCFFGAQPRNETPTWMGGWCPASVETEMTVEAEKSISNVTREKIEEVLLKLYRYAEEQEFQDLLYIPKRHTYRRKEPKVEQPF